MKQILKLENVVLVSKKKEDYEKKDGSKGCIYKVGLDQDGELGQLNCTPDAYEKIDAIKKYSVCSLLVEFNDNYSNIIYRVIDVI